MTNRIGPMDQGILGKIGAKVDETSTGKNVSPHSPAAHGSTAQPTSTGDTVNLTSSAKLLEQLDNTIKSLPTVNADRVSEIRDAIESGNYEIDSQAIADAMIRLDRSFGE